MNGSVMQKLSVILTIVTSLVLLALGYYDYSWVTKPKLSAELHSLSDMVAGRLDKGLALPLWNLDKSQVNEYILSEMQDPRVYSVLVRGSDGKIYSDMKRDNNWKIVPFNSAVTGKFITATKEILKDKDKLGTVEVFITTQFMDRELNRLIIDILLRTIFTDVFMVLTLFLSIKSVVIEPLVRIIEGLNEGVDQVAAAAGEVSSSSQTLAQGASEQAASIEETSASLEEMSSMTKQNANNAAQANALMQEAGTSVQTVSKSMSELTASMGDILKASDETSKIIKTIDEIAFQTNLLALNAAVEAARAGEAGAGFAVVADEVRNLALRAAEAAKTTASLIEGTSKKVKEGAEYVQRSNTAFTQVVDNTSKIGDLIGEIAAASGEQAKGIDQVNIAVSEMETVTQQNAASAEESASASEEMNAQAEQIKAFVNELVALVSGKISATHPSVPQVSRRSQMVSQKSVKHLTTIPSAVHSKPRTLPSAKSAPKLQHRKEVNPNEIIPFDDETDLKDF